MSKLLIVGRRFSRACFLCLGGALLLIASGALVGNLPTIRSGDWPPSELPYLYLGLTEFAIVGIIFVITAYGLYKLRRWGVYTAAVVSLLALIVFAIGWPTARSDYGSAVVYSFFATLFALTLVWALAVTAQELKEHARRQRGEGGQIA
jgi:hypothetical protein